MVENDEIRGPLRAATLRWRPMASTCAATIVCKATFVLRPGEAILSSEPDGIQEEDNHWNDDATRSVYAPCDLHPKKPRADVLLVGSAFAPNQQPARELVARLEVGNVNKSVRVSADRALRPDGEIVVRAAFTKMPLRYERAAGGPNTWNPVGMPPDAPLDPQGFRALPNLEPLDRYHPSAAHWPEPIGFGPIAAAWPGRRLRAGRAAGFPPRDWAAAPLPQEVDPAWFNVAPADQQPARLDGTETLLLENLHFEHARLATRLPDLAPRVQARRAGRSEAVEMVLDTLWIDTQRGVCSVVWRGGVVLSRIDEPLAVVAELAPRVAARTARTSSLPQTAPLPQEDVGATLFLFPNAPEAAAPEAPLPFNPAPPGASPLAAPSPRPPEREPNAGGGGGDGAITMTVFGGPAPAAPLPFAENRPALPRTELAPPTVFLPDVHEKYPPVPGSGVGAAGGLGEPPSPAARAPVPAPRPSAPAALSAPQAPPLPAPPPPPPAREPAWVPKSAEPASPWVVPSGEPASPWAGGGAPAVAKDLSKEQDRIAIPATPQLGSVGLLAASNAAAQARAAESDEDSAVRASPAPALKAAPRVVLSGEIVSFVWVDPEAVPRIRRSATWRDLLTALEDKPRDPDLDDPAFAADPMDIEDRRDVLEVLAGAPATDADGIRLAARDAAREDGKYAPPLLLCAGDLVMQFDETAMLQAMLATVTPILLPNDPVRPLVDVTKEFLGMPGLLAAPPVADALRKKLEEAFRGTAGRNVKPTYLEDQTERALVLARKYQKRQVFGAMHLRALLSLPAGQSFVVYLPEALGGLLPLQGRFGARFVAELHLPLDAQDPGPGALRLRALARVTRRA